jgi:uncharacterized protein (DUF362 family)
VSAAASSRVAICKADGQYPSLAPFDAHETFPEFTGQPTSAQPNPVYRAVRETLRLLGCDAGRFGTRQWNPFGNLVKPGNRVFIKPNLVTHEFRTSCGCDGDVFSVITHPSVVRAVADYAALALQGRGEIVIGDNPCIDADFDRLLEITQLRAFERLYPERFGVPCRVLDLRPRCTRNLKYYGFQSKTDELAGDPEGSSVLDLGEQSRFYGLNPLLFRGVFTNRWETIRHHHGRRHEYSISNTILNSDVYISVPKLKAHHKVGATLNIKGLVGVNANKNYLVHWRLGFPRFGGDEFPMAHRVVDYGLLAARHVLEDFLPESLYLRLHGRLDRALQLEKKSSHENYRGAWDGNDTCWRMATDLYRAFVQDAAGWREARDRQMKFFSVVDGVLAGERNGPFCPTGKRAEVILAGADLLNVDCVAARLMDYDVRQIRYLNDLLCEDEADPRGIDVVSDDFDVTDFFSGGARYLQFAPPSGWPRLALPRQTKEAAVHEDHHPCCR